MSTPRAVTRDDVARYAQVSPAVVSYVVNSGPKNVRPETRDRVLRAIQVLGYRPNGAARALKLGSQQIIGLVLARGGNAPAVALANAIEDYAKTRGFAVILTNSRASIDSEREHLHNLVSRQVDGILLASVDPDPDRRFLGELGVPYVLLAHDRVTEGVASVGPDTRAGARIAVEHLLGHGHRNIALITGQHARDDGPERGFQEALEAAGVEPGPCLRAPQSRFGGYGAAKRLAEQRRPVSAVFVASDPQAIGALRAFHELGLEVPGDMAMVSFDGSREADFAWPPLTTVGASLADMARDAVDKLLAVRRGEAAVAGQLYTPELHVRASCGCDHLALDS